MADLVLGDDDAYGWSPNADLYLVAAGPVSTRAPFGQPMTVRVVSATGSSRIIARAPAIVGAAWSPDGSSLVVSTLNQDFVPSLSSYVVSSDQRTVWTGATHVRGDFIVPSAWWNGWGVVYTVIGNGAVPNGEGSFEDAALYSLAGPDATPHLLGETLPDDSAGAPSATNAGRLAFVSDTGQQDPRAPWYGKQVVVCSSTTMTCAAVPAPVGDVTLDPVWSPSGASLAYVAAPGSSDYAFGDPAVSSWYGSHMLELYNPGSRVASTVEAAPGASTPAWSASGNGLVYEADNGLWLLANPGERPVEIASPLFARTGSPMSGPGIPSYYGQIDWSQQFDWSRSAPRTQCYVSCNTAVPG